MKNRLSLIVVLGMSLGVASCDTDYGSIDKDPYPNTYPIAGIWTGTFSYTPPTTNTGTTPAADTVDVTLVADESNEMWMIEVDQTTGCIHLDYGNAYSKQSTITGSYGFSAPNCPFTDGSDYGTGTISGTVDYHVTLSLTFTETDSKNFLYATFAPTFLFNDVYLSGSALSKLAGNYTVPAANGGTTGTPVSIDASGNITGVTVNSCTATGTVSMIDANYDLYRVNFTLANCDTADGYLNGIGLTGLGFLQQPQANGPFQFIFVAHGTDNNGLGVVFEDNFTT